VTQLTNEELLAYAEDGLRAKLDTVIAMRATRNPSAVLSNSGHGNKPRKRRRLSVAAKKRIAAAQHWRWAKFRKDNRQTKKAA